jgi:hypothetical protein
MRYSRPATVPLAWSSRWWQPRALLAAVQRSNRHISSRRYFNDPSQAMRVRREAYATAVFGTILSDHGRCDGLRMEAGNFPDFHLRAADAEIGFEITEADRLGRRRGQEYLSRPRMKPYYPAAEEEEARRVIPLRIAQKARKVYRPTPHLLVYVNLSAFARRADTDRELARSAEPWASCFGAIWLLWGGNAIRLTPTLERLTAQRDPFEQ